MSTGENINANGSVLTADIVRAGFFKFPQSVEAWLNPAQWPEVAPIQIAAGYPFAARQMATVPAGQVWFVGVNKELLGRIVNVR